MKAREEFQTLKGITKVQAVIRGHLVRRQAVATYSCIWGIVKLQALVRGKVARSLDTGVQLPMTNTVFSVLLAYKFQFDYRFAFKALISVSY